MWMIVAAVLLLLVPAAPAFAQHTHASPYRDQRAAGAQRFADVFEGFDLAHRDQIEGFPPGDNAELFRLCFFRGRQHILGRSTIAAAAMIGDSRRPKAGISRFM